MTTCKGYTGNYALDVNSRYEMEAIEPAESYRCCVCNALVFDGETTDDLISLGTCALSNCIESRIRDLTNEEKCLARIAELVLKPKNGQTDLKELEKQLASVRFWHVYRSIGA